jgi:hypothetical protein
MISAGTPTMAADESPLMTLQLLSLTLAYDDTRFFGSVMFIDLDDPDDKPATVLIDHSDDPPWFRLTNVDPTAQDPAVTAMVEADPSCGSSSATPPSGSAAPRPTSRSPNPTPPTPDLWR